MRIDGPTVMRLTRGLTAVLIAVTALTVVPIRPDDRADPGARAAHAPADLGHAAAFGFRVGGVEQFATPGARRSATMPSMNPAPQPPDGLSEAYYKVERQLRAAFQDAMKPQRSGASVDVRLYFREKPDGSLWGGLALLGEDGRIVDNMPLADPPSLPWLLGIACELGFEAAPRVRTKSRDEEGDELRG